MEVLPLDCGASGMLLHTFQEGGREKYPRLNNLLYRDIQAVVMGQNFHTGVTSQAICPHTR